MAENKEYNVLVIEDNQGDFVMVEDFLFETVANASIKHAVDFKAAENALLHQQVEFDIILLDLSLPDKTGISLIEQVVKLSNNVPIVVLTGYADFKFGIKSLSLGISDYILKDELTAMLLFKTIIYSIERKRSISRLEASEKQIRNFANQLNNVIEEERSRIAREIHDEFGQQLTGLKMSLSSLKRFKGAAEQRSELIDLMVDDVNSGIHALRRIANELRPVILDKLGLFEAIKWLVAEFKNKTGIEIHLYADELITGQLTKETEINIFRICQEAMTNIAKHAEATWVEIDIKNIAEQLLIKISDNGKGFISPVSPHHLSMGLQNMKERANMIGGDIQISSTAQKGTIIQLIINLYEGKNINSL